MAALSRIGLTVSRIGTLPFRTVSSAGRRQRHPVVARQSWSGSGYGDAPVGGDPCGVRETHPRRLTEDCQSAAPNHPALAARTSGPSDRVAVDSEMLRRIFVVARDQPDLYDYIRLDHFGDEAV